MSIQERHTENRVLVDFSSPHLEQVVHHLGEISANISESNKQLSTIARTLQGQLAVMEKQAAIDERNLQAKHVIYEIERALAYIGNLSCDVDKILNFINLDRAVGEIDTNREYLKDISHKHLMDKVINRVKDGVARIHSLNAEDKQCIEDFYDIVMASKVLVTLKQREAEKQLALEKVCVEIDAPIRLLLPGLIEIQKKALQDYFNLRFVTIIIVALIAASLFLIQPIQIEGAEHSMFHWVPGKYHAGTIIFVLYMCSVLIYYSVGFGTLRRCQEGKDGWDSGGLISSIIFDFTRVITCRSPRILRDSVNQNAIANQQRRAEQHKVAKEQLKVAKKTAEENLSMCTTNIDVSQKKLNGQIDDLLSRKSTLNKWFL
jgi:hypothetical protein